MAVEHDGSHLAVDQLFKFGQTLLESGSGSRDLERRARLINVTDSAVGPTPLRRLSVFVGIEIRIVRHRKNFTVVRVHDDDGHPYSSGVLNDLRYFFFDNVLNSLIDRRREAGPPGRGLFEPVEAASAGIGHHDELARGASDQFVVAIFDTAATVVVDVNESEYVGCEFPVGIEALWLFLKI